MSEIFDALRISEREQSGQHPSKLPDGPELLRDAERRVAKSWETAVSVIESTAVGRAKEPERIPAQFETQAATISETPSAGLLAAGERVDLPTRFKSLPIAVGVESHLVCLTDRKSPTAEAVRLLSVRLRDFRRIGSLKRVVITSSIPREGKSTIAANLACALARRADEKVLLVEGDMRLPAILSLFGIEQQPGIYELLREERVVEECVFHLQDAGIWILPAGNSRGNPLELLQSQKLPVIMDQLSEIFDWIIIDSPPVLPLGDTSIWMRLSDGVLLVARQGVTEKKQLQKGLEALQPQKVLGALLNGSKASRYSDYYYGESVQ